MLKTVALGLTTAASLSLGAAALTPALANYGTCAENPSSKGCPGYIETAPEFQGGVAGATQSSPRHMMHAHHQPVRYAPQKG